MAGLLGPVAIAIYAIVFSLPVRVAWWWPAWRGSRERKSGRLRSRSETGGMMAPLPRDSLARPILSQLAGMGFFGSDARIASRSS